jgi:AcrR family transcriptional regulator
MAAKRGKGKKPALTAERIRDEALALIEAEGLEAFSTRKLGRALGCEAMAIYWYYPSKDALLDAVVDTIVAQIAPMSEVKSSDWIADLRKLAFAYRGLARKYPNAFPLLATRRFATPGTYRFLEALFAAAREQGFEPRTTARYFRIVSSYCSGIGLDEIAGLPASDGGGEAEEGSGDLPHLEELNPWLQPEHFDEVFAYGLEVLLGSLAREPKVPRAASPRKRKG